MKDLLEHSSGERTFGIPLGIPFMIYIALGYKLTASKSCIFFSITIFSFFAHMVLPPETQREMKSCGLPDNS